MQKVWGKRGKFLTITLVVCCLFVLLDLFSNLLNPPDLRYADVLKKFDPSFQTFITLFLKQSNVQIIKDMIFFILFILIWKFKATAARILTVWILLVLAYAILSVFYFTGVMGFPVSNFASLIAIFADFLPFLLLLWAIKRKWKDFS